jgi:hypothetical protein
MLRRLIGVVIGFLLFFPGALVLQWLVVDELGLYQDMTLTDALLAIIIILAVVLLFGQPRRPLTAEELEEQAEKMELASRRLERAQRQHAQAVRSQRLNRRSSSRSAPSARDRRSSSSRSRTERSSSRSRSDRRRRR